MKAVIVELKDKYAAVLSDDGRVTKIVNNNYCLGQEIEMKVNSSKFRTRKLLAIASSMTAVFCLFGIGAYAYYTPYYYVSLDVNPSIEYSVNRFEKVIGVNGVNADGKEILTQLNLQNKGIDEAIKETVKQIEKEGYFTSDKQGGLVIATSCDNEGYSNQLANKLQTQAQVQLQNDGVNADVEAIGVGRERVLEAQKLGVTPGKLNLVEKLQESSSDPSSIDTNEWLNKPVKQIMKAIKDNKKNVIPTVTPTATSTSVCPTCSPQIINNAASATTSPNATGNDGKANGSKSGSNNSNGSNNSKNK